MGSQEPRSNGDRKFTRGGIREASKWDTPGVGINYLLSVHSSSSWLAENKLVDKLK